MSQKIFIIGSMSQADEIQKQAEYYQFQVENEVRYVKPEPDKTFSQLVADCFENILWADRVYIISKPDGSIGEGIIYEKEFARRTGKKIKILTRDISKYENPIEYAKNQAILEQVRDMVKRQLEFNKTGHGMNHIDRVVALSYQFADAIPYRNAFELELTALLHDVDDYKLQAGYNKSSHAKSILDTVNIPGITKSIVLENIDAIGYSKRLAGRVPETVEAKIVSDADMCDALGATGILRLQEYALNNGGKFFVRDCFPDDHTNMESYREARHEKGKISVCHMFDKILKLKDLMLTRPGQEEAMKRHQFMVEFLHQFFNEEDEPEWTKYLDAFLEKTSKPRFSPN